LCALLAVSRNDIKCRKKYEKRGGGYLGESKLRVLSEEATEIQLHHVPLVERRQVPSVAADARQRRQKEAKSGGTVARDPEVAAQDEAARYGTGASEDAGRRGGGGGEGFHGPERGDGDRGRFSGMGAWWILRIMKKIFL
jgi:hypothetical protein